MSNRWGGLRPVQVSEWINFDAEDRQWQYVPGASPSMASRQTEGVAYLWNLLSKHNVALLADEVGMGKTFQALGVAALLWRMKPSAKVLVMAPNRDICAHWQREFVAFTRFHYRHADERVSASVDRKPVPQVETFTRLRELAAVIGAGSAQDSGGKLYLTTIHSLSGLTARVDAKQDKLATASRAAQEVHRQILHALGDQGFDLIILDEAHYFRNRNGGSQRVTAASAFFGGPESRIGQRALLLTATPSHTHLGDVANVLSYFIGEDEARTLSAEELMGQYALRRFRIMAGNGVSYTKHQYRREIATPCDFVGRPEAEMFFALYQRRLIHSLGVLEEKRRVLYGFLEGFESAGVEDLAPIEPNDDDEQAHDERAKDFHLADDSQLLREMSQDYRSILSCAPDHPKYGRLVSQCVPEGLFRMSADRPLHEDKHLIFVRRIPSVRELTKRINEHCDRILVQHICAAWDLRMDDPRVKRWEGQRWSREGFNELIQTPRKADLAPDDGEDGEAGEDISEAGGEVPEQNSYLGSKIADLFVTKKAKDGLLAPSPTDCSRFSLNLRKTTSIHAMFMEPAADYIDAPYSWYYEFRRNDKLHADYTKAAQASRMSNHRLLTEDHINTVAPHDAAKCDYNDGPIETLWSLIFQKLDTTRQATLRSWAKNRPAVAENFANYIKAGFLFASPVVVELYGWHTRLRRDPKYGASHANVQGRYREFVNYVRPFIEGSLALKYFGAALDTFEQLCDKIIDHEADDWRRGWRTLTTLSNPAWYASGDSSHRQHLILGFNSPFYPNTLVATSVFQEGVNLHLQCRKLHHYGIAWTPGDNEQRIGRIDRLFGKVANLLRDSEQGTATLDINYPYLKNSFDEDQVGSFIQRKHAVEERMDRCAQGSFDKEMRMTRPGWHEFLRQPLAESALEDPYPARFNDADVPGRAYPGTN